MSDIREALSSAFEGASNEEAGDATADAHQPDAMASGGGSAGGSEGSSEGAGEGGAATVDAPVRARAPDGKFLPKSQAKAEAGEAKPLTPAQPAAQTPPPVVGEQAKTPPPAPGETSQALKPPQSWGPAVREHWSKLPAEVQAAIQKRETDMMRGLQEAAPARKFHDEFRATIAPFENHLRASGADPMKAIGSLLQTSYALTTAPPAQKAAVVAQIIKGYGVDIQALDSLLAGESPQPGQAQPQAQFDPQTIAQQVQQQVMQSIQQQRMEAQRTKLSRDLETFAQKHEFLDDVREDMADIIEVAARRGVAMSLEDAYARAVQLHPEISGVLQQRQAAAQAANANASTQKARAAASSVKSTPASVSAPNGTDDIRGTLEQAFSKAAGR